MRNVLVAQNNLGVVTYINMELVKYADVNPCDKEVNVGKAQFAVSDNPTGISLETYNHIVTKLNQWAEL